MISSYAASIATLQRRYQHGVQDRLIGEELCYSGSLVTAFVAALSEIPLDARIRANLEQLRPEQRVFANYAHGLLELAEGAFPEVALGVLAAEATTCGDVGLFDFLMASAATPRAAVGDAAEFIRLISDLHQLSLTVERERATVALPTRSPVPSTAEDFLLGSLIRNHVRTWTPHTLADVEIRFVHAEPPQLAPYRRALGAANLVFDATVSEFSFPARLLDLPLRGHERSLHEVLRAAAKDCLESLPAPHSYRDRVRMLVSAQLRHGAVGLAPIASELGLRPRSLYRRLSLEGTSFEEVVAEVRRQLALYQVAHTDENIEAIASLLGYSCTPPFHRAFRRWTGETPTSYRRRHRGLPAPRSKTT